MKMNLLSFLVFSCLLATALSSFIPSMPFFGKKDKNDEDEEIEMQDLSSNSSTASMDGMNMTGMPGLNMTSLPGGFNASASLAGLTPGGECFDAQTMALRAVKTALKIQLAPANTATFGAVFAILDKIIPLPPTPMDELANSASNPLLSVGNMIAPQAVTSIQGGVNNATGAVGSAASSTFSTLKG